MSAEPESQANAEPRRFERRDIERILRDAGVPKGLARGILATGWKDADSTSDPDDDTNARALADLIRDVARQLKG